jgi:arylsulfatase/arylsulfatase A
MARLKERQLLANTIVIFMCDNGPDGARFVGPMRGKKTEVLDGGIRSPFFLHWPARVPAGTTSDRIAAHIDVMPTLLAAAAVPVPAGLKLDGRNFLPLLDGEKADWPDRALVLQTRRGDQPIAAHNMAVRTQRWKLVHPSGFNRETPPPDSPFELYDVIADPMERTNLATREPATLQKLRDTYSVWFADVSSTRPNNFAPPRIIIGSDKAPITFLSPQEWRVPATGDNGREGHWLLHAGREVSYSVELRWLKPIAPGMLELTAGSVKRTVEVSAATDRVTMDRLALPAGDFDLSVVHRHGETSEGSYHLTLTRIP